MRLSKIKLSGFKSFVDPTTVHLPSNLVGVVGPNGSGKSNIIDAVRWVMGESSAKHLRGDSMADVIFNGSAARKPVGQASIELVFDNSLGKLGGQYAEYNEISIKRLVSRDGQSNYYLNGARCRRRDITDIFLGTGLGPRSYAIIEQGMISRLIEAKPEELRNLMEEAAGISKYKERRRETETRMKHTHENLTRINDLREELDKQLERLQRQARTAERYKVLKAEEREKKGQLLALQWREMDNHARERDEAVKAFSLNLEADIAAQRSLEASIEKQRETVTEEQDILNEIQAQFYQVGAEISTKEQAIRHYQTRKQELEQDLKQTEREWKEANLHYTHDSDKLTAQQKRLQELEPLVESVSETLALSDSQREEAEANLHEWQARWDEFTQNSNAPAQSAEVQRTRITHMEDQSRQLEQRHGRLRDESQGVDTAELERELAELDESIEIEQERLDTLLGNMQTRNSRISQQRETNQDISDRLSQARSRRQQIEGRVSSLEALQEAALGENKEASQWLQDKGLSDNQHLAQGLDVNSGWEKAVETVLGQHLNAICVDNLDQVVNVVNELGNNNIGFVEIDRTASILPSGDRKRLADQIKSDWATSSLLAGVFCADSVEQALAMRSALAENESVITPQGIWLGRHWLRINQALDEKSGVIEREKELKQLYEEQQLLNAQLDELNESYEIGKQTLAEVERERDEMQRDLSQMERRLGEIKAQRSGKQARFDQVNTRIERILREQEEIQVQLEQNNAQIQEARAALELALEQMEETTRQREVLTAQRDELRARVEETRRQSNDDRSKAQQAQLEHKAVMTSLESLKQNLNRLEQQIESLRERRQSLESSLHEGDNPVTQVKSELETLLNQRMEVEARLADARRKVEVIEAELRDLSEKRVRAEQKVQETRSQLDEARMNAQTLNVRRQTIQEHLAEEGHELSTVFEAIPEEASIENWEEQLTAIATKISKLGAINLAAIDEYTQEMERKKYLDEQLNDLNEALSTLENAIRKIDRETRAKFKETFDQVNDGLKKNFPKLFGGGQAFLELTGEDLLDTGVTIMARPPGKRISNIHLLSGGEKALTAVALVFSIFELNPAPFCMLDEVDAPLDEANVGRFCNLVKAMAEHVQFIFITHNKATMEIAQQLNGVTMHEPGVSRMVAVDVDEAAELAAM
ncbi:MAG: chromosome segregation protein SMC [Gammaproteobacteria bacterium]|nr:chromosome segregation protein SMC [Gammaproteobacteria bacterium]